MVSNFFKRFFCFLTVKYRKHGFTLAEAMIITVMAGACLLPIMGTMQNAQVRTENFDHQSKMQQYARSRLTAEIANAAFDHKSINLDDEYHYIVYFASSTSDESAEEADAKLIELPKSYVTLEDLASLTLDPNHDNWATSAVDLLGINRDKGAPYLTVVHAYKTSVESKNNPGLSEFGNNSNIIDTPKALLAIVVKTSLIKSNDNYYDPQDGALIIDYNDDGSIKTKDDSDSVLPVTLFSFVNLPTASDEMIWLADALNCVLYGIDPISRGVTTISLPRSANHADKPDNPNNDPYRPWHIAVHPSLKLLAVMMQEKIILVNTDSKSSFNTKIKTTTINKSSLGNNICKIDKDYNLAYEDGGICFRPDGKVLFFTQIIDKSNSKIYAYELKSYINPATNTMSWETGANDTPYLAKLSTSGVFCSLKDDKITGIKPSNDGYLYVAYKDIPKDKNPYGEAGGVIYRYPMYPSNWSNWNGEEFAFLEGKHFLSIDVSPDGRRLAAITEPEGQLIEYDTKSKTQLYNPLTIKNTDKMPTPFKNAYVAVSDKNTHLVSEKGLSVAVTSKNEVKKTLIGNFESSSSTPFRNAKAADGTEGGFVIVSPDGKHLVTNDKKKPWLYFWNTGTTNAEDSLTIDNNGISEFKLDTNGSGPKQEKGYTSLETTKRDLLAAGFENNDIKLYDLNTFKELEDEGFVATCSLSNLAMNNYGNALISCHDNNTTGCYVYNITDGFTKNPTVDTYRRKAVFDDNWPNMAFVLQYKKSGDEITKEGFCNLYYSVADRWETASTDSYDRRNYIIDSVWRGIDIIGMPNGGAMVLYGKTDGSSMIEWIGRRNWGSSNVGKYKLFARWTNICNVSGTESFLPYNSLTNYTTTDSDIGVICRLVAPLEANTEVNSLDFQAADGGRGLNFNDDSTRCITPIVLKKGTSGKFTVVNYATNKISTKKGEVHTESITWKYPFRISQSDTYYLGWWNGFEAESTKGVIGYDVNDDDNVNTNAQVIGNFGWASAKTLPDLLLKEIDDVTPIKRNYNIKFKITPVQQGNGDFPPLFSKKIAISPDCGTLAVLATDTSDVPVINFYDFNNQIYGPDTQIEGLLIDYRKPKDSGKYSGTVVNPWPEETGESLFGKVEDDCEFKNIGTEIFNLKKSTTKYDSWTSFNDNPCNYFAGYSQLSDNGKGFANKRFIGYIRPESDYSFMQMYFTDEPRVFINNSLVYGTIERGAAAFINNSVPVALNSYRCNLFQLDYASNKGNMNLGVFFNKNNDSTFDSSGIDEGGSGVDSQYYKLGGTNPNKGWVPLSSPDTYILNNKPSLIGSRNLKTTSAGSKLDLAHGDMFFSRDRAKPVLFVRGKIYLWVIYNNKLIRAKVGANQLHSIALSSDGQKIICGKTSSSKNYISVLNISSPNESLFTDDGNELDLNTDSNIYLGEIASFSVGSKPQYLATKPLPTYNSSKIGGEFKEITNPTLNGFTSSYFTGGSMTVASGGIYIYGGSKDIVRFNPLTDKTDKFENALKNASTNSSITSYENILYILGNAGDGTSQNPRSNRVQSYNVNTNKALTSLNEVVSGAGSTYTDSYQVNMGYVKSGSSNFIDPISNYISGSNVNDPKKAFIYLPESYARTTNTNPYIDIKFDSPLTVNKILITNHKHSSDTNSDDKSVRKFRLEGANSSSFTSIKSIDDTGEHGMDINTSRYFESIGEQCFKTYRLYLTHVIGSLPGSVGFSDEWCECSKEYSFGLGLTGPYKYDGVVNLIQLWRTGVKRVMPQVGDTNMSTYASSFNVKTDEFTWKSIVTVKNSVSHDQCDLKDVYIPDKSESNTIENNVFTSKSQGWDTSKSYPCILAKFSSAEAVCAVRYANSNKSNSNEDRKTLKMFKLFGTNIDGTYNPSDFDDSDSVPNPDIWKPIIFTNNTDIFVGPNVNDTFITAEVKAPQKYKYYLFKVYDKYGSSGPMRLIGFEMFSGPEKEELPSDDYMTPMKEDNLTDIKVSDGAVCATPYGLIYTGGVNESNAAVKTALLYWPHAINKYNGHFNQYGISRSLPDMNVARYGHALVWHKGKIYAIGGKKAEKNYCIGDDFIECLDYNTNMTWQTIKPNYINITGIEDFKKRAYFGACSFGDEIFIFAGEDGYNTNPSSNGRSSCFAWNTETNFFRKINDTKIPGATKSLKLSPCTAVPFGSKIYIFGRDTEDGNIFKMIEYTP